MIDLHIHTACSDGTWTVDETLQEAEKAGVTVLSITDHNTVKAYTEMRHDNTGFSGKIINGVEIDCVAFRSKIELLGYDFQDIAVLDEWLREQYSPEQQQRFRRGEYERLLAALDVHGVTHHCEPVYEKQDCLPHMAVYNEITKYASNAAFMSEKEWNHMPTFFRTATVNPRSVFHIEYTGLLPSAEEAAAVIRKAGGKVFLAHVFQYGMDDHMQFIDTLRTHRIIDGIEVYYVDFTTDQMAVLYEYCQKYGLYMSGGSDTHGDKGTRKIGIGNGDLCVPEAVLEAWANW